MAFRLLTAEVNLILKMILSLYYAYITHTVDQHGPTDGSRATSCPRPLVIRPVNLFVYLLQVTITSFIFFTPKYFKKSRFLSRLPLYVQVSHMLLTLKPYSKI
jgi:hypothetical protein